MTQLDALTRPFAGEEIHQFQGRGGQTLSYADDESVMDRLDEAFGSGGWSLRVEPIPVYEGVVKVRIEAGGAVYEDFGYPNNQGGEQLKEAVSDGIRRCGRMLGIGRDLYRRDAGPTTQGATGTPRPVAPAPSSAAGRGAPSPRPAVSTVPVEPEGLMEPVSMVEAAHNGRGPGDDEGTCPQHPGKSWSENRRGFYCATKVGESPDGKAIWCDETPTQRWIQSRAAVGAGR